MNLKMIHKFKILKHFYYMDYYIKDIYIQIKDYINYIKMLYLRYMEHVYDKVVQILHYVLLELVIR